MQLMMYLNNDLIESIQVDIYQISRPGYLGQFKRVLKQKHISLIQESETMPEFLVVDPIGQANSNSHSTGSCVEDHN
jgi:hypothetical protein